MIITKKHGEQICSKLRGTRNRKRPNHEEVTIYYKGKRVARYSIRRGSKELGHGHIPKQIHLSWHQTVLLAQCEISKEDYYNILRDKDTISADT